MPTDTLCPVIFVRNFLNHIGPKVDFKKEIVSLNLGETENEIYFSKFKDRPLQIQEEKEKNIEVLAALFFSKQEEEANKDSNYEDIIMEDNP